MLRATVLVLPLVSACVSDIEGPETGAETDSEEDFDTDVTGPDRRDSDGTCTPSIGTCEGVAARELLVVDEFFVRDGTGFGPFSDTITSEGAWQTWWQDAGSGMPIPEVDFTVETVLIAGYRINASCDTRLSSYEVTNCDSVIRLTATSTDTSGTCSTTCDSEGGTVVAVAISSGATEVCAQVDLSCASAL